MTGDLFGYDQPQGKLFEPAPPPSPGPIVHTPETIRALMLGILAEARAADACPWTPRQLQSHRGLFPFMAEWLKGGEGDTLQAEFDAHLARFGV